MWQLAYGRAAMQSGTGLGLRNETNIFHGGDRVIATAEGNGPVNALDAALRSAVTQQYPELANIDLVDYKVRILTGGTEAVTSPMQGTMLAVKVAEGGAERQA